MVTAKKTGKAAAAKKSKAIAGSIVEEAIAYEVGIRELRQDASRVIALVESGASITITRHGKPVATINPPQKTQLEKWIEEGKVTPATRKINFRTWKPKAGPASPELLGMIERERPEARY